MDYEGADSPIAPPAIELDLGPGFFAPEPELVARIAERVAAPQALSVVDKFWWVPSVPAGAAAFLLGESWALMAVAMLSLAALPVTSILWDRRRRRLAARAR